MEYSGPRFSLLTFGLGWCWLCKGQVKSASTSITIILSELQNFWSIFKVIRNFDQDNCNHVLLSSITFACMFLPLGLRVAIDKPLGWTIQQAFQEQLRLLTSERRWRSPMRPHVVRSEVSLVVQMCIFCDSNQSQFCVSLLISLPVFIWFGSCRVFPWYKVHRRSSLNDRFMHPNGQLPAYEWNFNDVNPPVHAGLPKHVLFVVPSGSIPARDFRVAFHRPGQFGEFSKWTARTVVMRETCACASWENCVAKHRFVLAALADSLVSGFLEELFHKMMLVTSVYSTV